jgi:XRE family transcriptional regulator, fatty acid utilization regulator
LAEQAEGQFLELCNWYHNLEVWCDEQKAHCLPDARRPRGAFRYPDAERLAHEVRRELELGDHPAMSLLKVLEEVCAVKVFHLPLEPSGTAACSRSDDFGAAILLNSNNVRWRRNFDLAHELFHLLTWPIFRTEQSQEPDPMEEKLATCFARHLLMPAEAFRDAVNEYRSEEGLVAGDVTDIARLFDVSVDAVAWHAAFLFNMADEDAQRLIAAAKAMPDVRESDTPAPRPERFRALAVKALHAGQISIGRFAEYVGVSRSRAMRYVEQGEAEDEEIAAAPA